MKKTNFKNFIRTIKQSPDATLDIHEKKEIRSALFRDLGIRPEAANSSPAKTPSPFVSGWMAFTMSMRIRAVAVASLAFVIASGSIAYAAELSLPGDILYSVKTHVNENVVRAVKSATPAAKAAYEVKLVDKRLKEAEKLDRHKRKNREEKAKFEVVNQSVRAQKAAIDKDVLDESLGAIMNDHKDLIKKWSDDDNENEDDTDSEKSSKNNKSRGKKSDQN